MRVSASAVSLASLMFGVVSVLTSSHAVAEQVGAGNASASVEPVVFEQGRQLYNENCIACHQAGGVGAPPNFPTLTGNVRLGDINLIVRTIRLGSRAMPAFPNLTAPQVAAVATYVRNAWNNKFGATTADQVTAILAGLPKPADPKLSIWSGVYTKAQSTRGEEVHSGACATCHGPRLNGAGQPDMPPSPAIARATFLRKWAGQTVAALFVYVRTRMPPDNPGTLTDQQYIDAVAHMLDISNMPAGDKELPADPGTLASIVIEAQPK